MLVQAGGKAWGLSDSKISRGKVTCLRTYMELGISH